MNIVLSEEQAQEVLNALASTPIGRAINIMLATAKPPAPKENEKKSKT